MSAEPRAGSDIAVVRIIARLNVGGPALHTIYLSRLLESTYPTLLVAGQVSDGEGDMTDIARAGGVNLHTVATLGREIRFGDDLRTLIALVRVLRKLRPSIVHTHTAKAGTIGRVAALLARVPIRVHTFHGHTFHGYFSPRKTRVFLFIERVLSRFTTCVVTISASQRDDIVTRYRVCAPEKVRVIPLGLDLERFKPVRTRQARNDFRREIGAGDATVVTIVGRLVPIKNHDLYLDAAERIARSGRRCLFVIVGGGSESARLQASARARGLSVLFLGWRDDLEAVYAGSDIVALTSLNEGTPLCLIEALAAGCAVVATDVGGVADVLEQGAFGLLSPSQDADAFAANLARLIDDAELRRAMAMRSGDSIRERYDLSRLVRDMSALYQDLEAALHARHRATGPSLQVIR